MNEKEPPMPPPVEKKAEILRNDRHLFSLLSPEVSRQIDYNFTDDPGFKPRYYDSLEQANQAPILSFDHVASSVLVTFDDGDVMEIFPIQKIGELEFDEKDSEMSISRLRMSGEKELAPEVVKELLGLPSKSHRITEAKLVYWQSDQKLIPPK